MKPTVGLPATRDTRCAFALDLDAPGCAQDATVHLLVQSPAWGLVALASCDDHVRVARAAGELLGEHPRQPTCLVIDCWAGLYERTDTP